MGRKGRAVSGILLLDKPAGRSSNQALQEVKRLFRARKAGHTGSLDPLATGLLPICLGEATKISGFLLDADKRYRVTCRLGVTTTTGDAEGDVVAERPVPELTDAAVAEALAALEGEQDQVPPMHSAVKHQGQRLYRLAREGKEVERKARRITVYRVELLTREADQVTFQVHCTKGTYVRTLAEDLGERLGTGAHVTALRREMVGGFSGDGMIALETLRATRDEGGPEALDRLLLPVEAGLQHWPDVDLEPDTAHFVRHGQAVWVPRAPAEGWVRLFQAGTFLGMGVVLDDGRIAPRRLINR